MVTCPSPWLELHAQYKWLVIDLTHGPSSLLPFLFEMVTSFFFRPKQRTNTTWVSMKTARTGDTRVENEVQEIWYIPLLTCHGSYSWRMLPYFSRIIFLIDGDRSVTITPTSAPRSRRWSRPLWNPIASIATELDASVTLKHSENGIVSIHRVMGMYIVPTLYI